MESFADFNLNEVNNNWGVGVWVDDFEDTKSCAVMTLNSWKRGNPNLILGL